MRPVWRVRIGEPEAFTPVCARERTPDVSGLKTLPAPGDVPLFVRENTLLPVAKPVQHVAPDTVFEITVKVYGDAPAPFTLVEDDGETFDFERGGLNRLTLSWADGKGRVEKSGRYTGPPRYSVAAWEKVPLAVAP